jgi:hypothetical protein
MLCHLDRLRHHIGVALAMLRPDFDAGPFWGCFAICALQECFKPSADPQHLLHQLNWYSLVNKSRWIVRGDNFDTASA